MRKVDGGYKGLESKFRKEILAHDRTGIDTSEMTERELDRHCAMVFGLTFDTIRPLKDGNYAITFLEED